MWLAACGGGANTAAPTPDPTPWQWSLPAGWAPPLVPADNPMNDAKVELGRRLFHEPRLSGNGTLACSGCHAQASAFTDDRALARGATGEVHPRNAQPLTNVAYNTTFNWARPDVRTLEQQMAAPLFNTAPVEMGVNEANRAAVLARIAGDADYRARFGAAFAGQADAVSWDNIIRAIATFERTLISASSKFDQWQAGQATLTAAEERGRALFFGNQALCARCHGSPNFNDQFVSSAAAPAEAPFHNTGLFNIGSTGAYPEPNRGIFEVTKQAADMGKFRAASLRNIELTAPYMHDGSIGTLEAVIDFYAAGGRDVGNGLYAGDGRANPFKDPLIGQIRLAAQDKSDLLAFLKTLTDASFTHNPRFAPPVP
ncbi:MbnH family di-heme enzyme [Ottowia sp.]|uniref:MbnH family di-heme enzyme n=1 Tax=Ottowia sp. TaxID=1898956 RepID=UPI002BC520F4|nr:MbnH family di-heme enzyme [Ottowia sp.]HOB66225.1 di-heme enzyme [Ottowia sp.]